MKIGGWNIQVKQTHYSKNRGRTLDMAQKLIKCSREICIERAVLFTESYRKTKGEVPVIRFAKAIVHLLEKMTIQIWDNEFIVGNRCSKYVGTPLYPEIRIDTLEEDYESYENRSAQKFFLSEDERKILFEDIFPYWKNEDQTVRDRFLGYITIEEREMIEKLIFIVDAELINGVGHFLPGHENVLKHGINGLIRKSEEKIKNLSSLNQNFDEELTFLKTLIIVYNGVREFIRRFSNLAHEKAKIEVKLERQNELYEISEICKNISENPPKSFKEALQLIYFTHLICGLEDGGFAISIGRLDQYLYSYYIKDKNEGKINPNEAQFLIECFFIKLSSLWNYLPTKGIVASEGPPIAENLSIGGVDRDGNDATNELSCLILDSYASLKTVQPTFSVRIHENTSDDFLVKVGEAIKSGASIALFNDEVIIKGLQNRGFTLGDAREYAPVGCVEPQHPYKSFGSTNSNQINIVKCLELALNSGIDMFTRRKYGVSENIEINSYEDLWNAFKNELNYFIKIMVSIMFSLDKAIAELTPKPFLSATIDDCIGKAVDITKGGAIYNFTGPQLIGFATVVDSLAVIKKMVFDDKLLQFEELVEMLKRNYKGIYQGRTGKEWREYFINKVPKFGNDNDYVDSIAVEVAKLFCDEISKHANYRGGIYNPGIYSTTFHLAFGMFTAASADGRKSRDFLSNGVGPSQGRDISGPTAILNSIKKLENELITNGTSLILAFHPNTFKNNMFVPLIKSFFQANGGLQIQFNVIGKEILCNAQQNPKNYQGLVVRIAGYSVLFAELSKRAQDDIIARTQF